MNMESVCKLDCAECPAYLAKINDDDELRKKTAKEWNKRYERFGASFTPESINCVGCYNSDGVHSGYCSACQIRKCAIEKNVKTCSACTESANCGTRKEFEKIAGRSIG